MTWFRDCISKELARFGLRRRENGEKREYRCNWLSETDHTIYPTTRLSHTLFFLLCLLSKGRNDHKKSWRKMWRLNLSEKWSCNWTLSSSCTLSSIKIYFFKFWMFRNSCIFLLNAHLKYFALSFFVLFRKKEEHSQLYPPLLWCYSEWLKRERGYAYWIVSAGRRYHWILPSIALETLSKQSERWCERRRAAPISHWFAFLGPFLLQSRTSNTIMDDSMESHEMSPAPNSVCFLTVFFIFAIDIG